MLVTLEPGANAEGVVDLLFDAKTLIGNHHSSPDRYLDWVADTARMLRNHVRRSDIERLLFTPRLWRIQDLAGRADRFTYGLLSEEIADRAEMFEQAWQALSNEVKRWSPPGSRLAVVDTSVFIHHPDKIREIDYAHIIGAGFDAIRLVVPRVVVDELDRLKESGNQGVRWRAGHTLGVLDELLQQPRSQVTLRERDNFSEVEAAGGMPHDRVSIEVLYDDKHHARLADNDDEIIDRALALQAYANRPVGLLTMDTSMALRARMLDLRVYKQAKDIGAEPAQTGRATATQ